jgi:ABC-2 type transport system permease protein
MKKHPSLGNMKLPHLKDDFKEILAIFVNELKVVSHDRGVVLIFIIAVMAYPLLYSFVYKNESLVNLPVAAVDNARDHESAELIRHLNATPEIDIISTYATLDEARKAFEQRIVNGIVYIPSDFGKKINTGQQTTLSVYCDMSSFLYYRTVVQGVNHVVLDMSKSLQIRRLNAQGITGEAAKVIADPVPYDDVVLYNAGAGYASFLVPVVLILILYQTLFFGISILSGTAREENRFHVLVSSSVHKGSTLRVVLGKSIAYFIIYMAWSVYILRVIPQLFNLPHIGDATDLLLFVIPFLASSIFFFMTLSVFMPNRETGMLLFGIFSLILLFLGGVSWPYSNMTGFWKALFWVLPCTQGIQGYIKINTMGADLHTVSTEYITLWVQTCTYLILCVWAYHWQIHKSKRKAHTTKPD